MLDYLAVTSFSETGFDLYGRRFLRSFIDQTTLPLAVFTENREMPWTEVMDLYRLSRGDYRLLREEPGWDAFQQAAPVGDATVNASYWERWDQNGRRFSHKVFAITSDRTPESRWRIWIDADVEFHAPLTEALLRDICPEDRCLSFLGRRDFGWSECGFVAYKVSDPRVRALLADMRRVYTSGELFTLPRDRWHDSAVFDLCRARSGIPESEQHNLSAGVKGREVWEHTLLQSFARHNKGPARKLRVYGGLAE